ncbi:MAG: DUF1963 domain-containing protein [Lawsonibacter sp.]|nr:DUF1963 domain-containing protein [Lawsonibacter sp.]
MEKIKADPLALNAIFHAVLKGPSTTPDDFGRVTLADTFSIIYHTFPDWAEVSPGDFSILGRLENLHTLHFPNDPGRPPIRVSDFSFLARCPRLKRLDVARTNFSDCSILLRLPPLSYVRLPQRSQLTHLEALDRLPKKTRVSFLAPPAPWPPSAPPFPLPRAPRGSETAKAILAEIQRQTACPCYEIELRPGAAPGLTDSKFGGLPYWDPALPYPEDRNGEKLILLAQINFDQFPPEPPLPPGGMLQFFAGGGDLFGMDWSCPDRPDGFRVVYHRRIDPSVTPERLAALHLPTHREPAYFPVLRETAVSLRRSTAWMGPADGRFDAVFARAFQAVTGRAPAQGENFMDVLGDEDVRFLLAALSGGGHRLLGYPSFTQGDPRPADSPCRALLFQMDSDFADGTDYVMWGDAGAGHFFIRPEDLERRDFSRVYYTWDCG